MKPGRCRATGPQGQQHCAAASGRDGASHAERSRALPRLGMRRAGVQMFLRLERMHGGRPVAGAAPQGREAVRVAAYVVS